MRPNVLASSFSILLTGLALCTWYSIQELNPGKEKGQLILHLLPFAKALINVVFQPNKEAIIHLIIVMMTDDIFHDSYHRQA